MPPGPLATLSNARQVLLPAPGLPISAARRHSSSAPDSPSGLPKRRSPPKPSGLPDSTVSARWLITKKLKFEVSGPPEPPPPVSAGAPSGDPPPAPPLP